MLLGHELQGEGEMGKIYSVMYKIMLTVLIICTAYCFGISVFGKKAEYNSIILLVGILVYTGIVCAIYHKCKELTDRNLNCIIIVMLSIYLVLTVIFGLKIKSERPADIFNLHNAAVSYLQTGEIRNIDYFSWYPYQLSYTYLIIVIYKIGSLFGISDYRTSGTLFGVMLLFFSAFLVYKIAKRIKNKCLGVIALFVFVTNPVFWIYSSYYYTDLIGMVLILLLIDIALFINTSKRNDIWLYFLWGLIFFAGYKFRATVAIGGIAVFALGIIRFNKSKEKYNIRCMFAVVIGCALVAFIFNIIDNFLGIELDKNKQFPIVHWIMMGLSEESGGKWSQELWNYTYSFPTYDEKMSANIEAVKRSLSEMGTLGVIRLLFNKLSIMWTEGMTAVITNFKTSIHYGNLYEYTIGNKNAVTYYSTQIMRSTLLLCTIPYLFYEMKNKFSKKSILAITFFGYMIFYFFWEVHEKYVLMFLPLLIVMAGYGVSILVEFLVEWQRIIIITDGGQHSINKLMFFHILKKTCLGVCIVSVLLYVLNWNNMVVKNNIRYNYIVYQSSANNNISIENEAIRQTFFADMDFNAIFIRFLNNDVPKEQEYFFSLFDNNETCIYQEKFVANDIGNDTYHAFYFNSVQTDRCHQFYFEIVAVGQYEETLKICSAGNGDSDYYSGGRCIVNNVCKGDLTFRVYDVESASYYSKSFYILMATMVVLIEIIIYRFICKAEAEKMNV